MGWTTTRRIKNESKLDIIDRIGMHPSVQIVEVEIVGTTVYMAYETGTTVRALVMIQEYTRDEVSFKIMGEEEGPMASTASADFVGLLSPTTDEYALGWRTRCLTGGK